MARRPDPGDRAALLAVLRTILKGQAHGREAKMLGFPAFSASGKRFACVYGKGIGLKLPAGRVRELERQPGFCPFRHSTARRFAVRQQQPQFVIFDAAGGRRPQRQTRTFERFLAT